MARIKSQIKSSGKSILLVDDQEEYRLTASSLIKREGHEVITAPSGEEALEILKSKHFDLLLLDYYMFGGINGEETVRELRAFNPHIQVILQTGYSGDKPPREMLRRLDIQGYYDKSDGPEKLLLWVDIGLKAAHTIHHLTKSRQSLKYILDITPELQKLKQLKELLQGILLQVSGLMGILNSFIAVFPENQEVKIDEDLNSFVALLKENSLHVKASTGRFDTIKVLDANDDYINSESVKEALKNRDIKINSKTTILPLFIGDEILGIIYLEKTISSKENIELLNLFANQAAVAIQNTYLYEMATLDPLTGVYSRRFFDNCLLRELRTALRSKQEITLLVVDMDKLKELNDSKGHIAGDQALTILGEVLKKSIRPSDYPCRYGGDEFTILLTNTSIKDSKMIVKRI